MNPVRPVDDEQPTATVRMVDGQLVLDDPAAVAVIRAVAKHNCRQTMTVQADRVANFVRRMGERGDSPDDVVIVVLNVDDPHGGRLADALMPGHDWQAMRDRGEVPFARGLAGRDGIQELLDELDKDAAEKLRALVGKVAVLVMDHGAMEVFTVTDGEEVGATDKLASANAFVATHYPLPRCVHENALRDHSGEPLEPSCGCRSAAAGSAKETK